MKIDRSNILQAYEDISFVLIYINHIEEHYSVPDEEHFQEAAADDAIAHLDSAISELTQLRYLIEQVGYTQPKTPRTNAPEIIVEDGVTKLKIKEAA